VDRVSLSLNPAETLGLVGESGCGKSVTALSVLRLLPKPAGRIASGQILFKGRDLVSLPETKMRRIRGNDISMIFQEPMTSLNPVYSVGFQIVETIRRHRRMDRHSARQAAVRMLSLVGIPDPEARVQDYPHQLSGGMRQRVMIAMALSCHPQVMIADEPTTALDVTIQAQVINLLEELKDRFGLTYIFISHDLSVVEHICDRVAVMYLGRLVELANRHAFYQRPLHPYAQALLSAAPVADPGAERNRLILSGDVPSPINPPPGCTFHPRCPHRMPVCSKKRPRFQEIEPERWVACYLYFKPADRSRSVR
jgi:oligopeptide/dipeptide ABC transporter ATP-binding protein